jgi:hypothetical protein
MAGLLLEVGATVWLLAGLAAIGLGARGAGWLMSQLPPLAIDVSALGGAVVAIGAALVAVGVLQAVVAAGLRARRRWAVAGGVLLSATLAVALFGLAAAAATTLVRGSPSPALLAIAGIAAFAGVGLYAWCAAQLIDAMRIAGVDGAD